MFNSGTKEGQTLLVKTDSSVEVHKWSNTEFKWSKIGDVVGENGGNESGGGKTMYEGKVGS